MPVNPCKCMVPRPTKQHARRIAVLEAREVGYIQSLRELEAENQTLVEHVRTAKQLWENQVAENQRLREAHNDNLEEYEFFVKQDQTHSKLIDWKIVCGYLANRSKAALLAVLLEENQDKIARFKAWEEQEWTKKPE